MRTFKTLLLTACIGGIVAPVLAETVVKDPIRDKYENDNPQPVILNDACSAFPITYDTDLDFSGADHPQVWFEYVGTGDGLWMETCLGATNFDSDLRVYTGDCDGTLTEVFYKDGASDCSWRTFLRCADFTFLDGVTYYLRIDRYFNASLLPDNLLTIRFEECAPPPPPPANDVYTGAFPILPGECVTGSTEPYTDTTGGYDNTAVECEWVGYYSALSTGASRDAWYMAVLPAGAYTFSLEGSTYDTALGIFDENLTLVAGNDDFSGLQSAVECCYLPGGTYYIAVDGFGSSFGDFQLCVTACAPVDANELPAAFELGQNFPNPFNPATTIEFSVAEATQATLAVFDLAGRQVATLVNGMVERGAHSVTFDAGQLTSGVYFYTLSAEGQSQTRKMVLVK
jgi:hypothetical protein